MDNLTHTLAGAALGEAGLKRVSGLGMAALMIGANLPDLDALAIPFGANLTFRRGLTHGPLAMVILPIVLAILLVGWDRLQARRGTRPTGRNPVRPGPLLLLCYLGVLSHPMLDWLNTYGIRLLAPFSERWFYGDSIFIIDPLIWLVLGLGVLVPRWSARRRGRPSPRPARVALVLVGAYVTSMVIGSRHAHSHASSHMIDVEGTAPLRVMAGPVPLDPLRRELIYDMGDHYRFGTLVWRPSPRVTLTDQPLPTNLDHPAAQAGRALPEVQAFLFWSRFPYFAVDERADTAAVRLGDARFVGRDVGWFGVSYRIATGAVP